MKNIYYFFFTLVILIYSKETVAQDSSSIFLSTGTGIIKSPGALHHVLHPSVAFNSGIEVVNKKKWFVQGTLDFNSLKYNQRIKTDGSPYLFLNTSSSLIMIAANGGKNFDFFNNRWFSSLYAGGGYLNIGEPRLVDDGENTFRQEVSRKGGIFGKTGVRIGYKTKIKFLQTIYFDGAYWRSPVQVQGAKLTGVSLFIGLRMGMN